MKFSWFRRFHRGELKNLREKLRYRFDQIFARGSFAQLILLGCVTALVVLFGMSAYFFGLFDKRNSEIAGIGRQIDAGAIDALWWSAKHIFDPSFFDSNYGASWPIVAISLVMSIMGMSLFATLLGFISSGIEGKLEALRKGNSAVKEEGHLLILGWNDKIFSILSLLESKQESIKVVILSQHGIEEMNELLRVRGQRLRNVKTILRTGSPKNLVELERVAFSSAFSIIVLGDESSQDQHEPIDLRVIKTLMLLVAHEDWKDAQPKMVAEIVDKDYLQVARIAAGNKVSIICSSVIISKVIVQTARQPGLSHVYSELFGFAGNGIFIRDFPACAGRRFNDIRACFRNAVPIGISRVRLVGNTPVFEPHINPGVDYCIQRNEWIILVARNERIAFDAAPTSVVGTDTAPEGRMHQPMEQILILGWNDQLYDILEEFDDYMTETATVFVAAAHAEEHALDSLQENLGKPLEHVVFKYQRVDYVKQSGLTKLPIEQVDHLILLADESSHEADPDSRTIMALLMLRNFQTRGSRDQRGRVVAEIVNASNCELLRGEKNLEFVVSPRIVSMLLTQISQQLMLKAVYEDLLSAGGNEIYLKPVRRYTSRPEHCTFDDIANAAAQRNEIAIGLKLAKEGEDPSENQGVHINPARDGSLALSDQDKVIVLALDLYDQ